MQPNYSANLILPLNDILHYENILSQAHPRLFEILPEGIDTIVNSAMEAFSVDQDRVEAYLENCIDLIDYLIEEEESNKPWLMTTNTTALVDLYMPEFHDLLITIFENIYKTLRSVLMTKNFSVTKHFNINDRTMMVVSIITTHENSSN